MLNPGGLRRSDEFVRHKMLDALGDLALAGAPILGAYRGVRAGHGATNRLLRQLFATPGAWEIVTLDAEAAAHAARRGRGCGGPAPRRLRQPTQACERSPRRGCAFRFNPPVTCANPIRPAGPERSAGLKC